MAQISPSEKKQSWVDEIIQPFIDLAHAPRALWGINLAYVLEGMVYGVVRDRAKPQRGSTLIFGDPARENWRPRFLPGRGKATGTRSPPAPNRFSRSRKEAEAARRLIMSRANRFSGRPGPDL